MGDFVTPGSAKILGRPDRLELLLLAFTVCAMGLVTVLAWPDHIYDRSPVRQTQTLLTIASFLKNGFALAYETPIFAHPWQVPLEFPLYQGVAAAISFATAIRPAYAAQATTLVFFGLCLLVAKRSLGQIGASPNAQAITVALILASPTYLFWSQTVTIESTALFFSLTYFDCLIAYARTRRLGWLALSSTSGALASAVKSTTFTVWAIVAFGALLLHFARQPRGAHRVSAGVWLTLILAFVVPVAVGVAWTHFADGVKAQNGSAVVWASTNLHTYALGTIQQKLSLSTWKTLLLGRPLQILGSPLPLLAVPLALLRSAKWRLQIALCVGAYVAAYAVFTNLHILHDYYSYSNGVLLIVAVGLSIDSLLAGSAELAAFARWALLPGTLVLGYCFFLAMFAPAYMFAKDSPLGDLALVRDSTATADVLAFVQGSNSEIAYATGRRVALATPEILRSRDRLSAAVGPDQLGAVGYCGEAAQDSALTDWVATAYQLLPLALPVYPQCAVFVSARNASRLEVAARLVRERARVILPPPNEVRDGDAAVTARAGTLLNFWGAARYRCPVTKGQRVRVLFQSPSTTLAFPTDRTNADPGERYRFSMMRAYDRWYDGTVDTSVTLTLSPYVLGPETYRIGLEISPPPACAPAPVAVVWTDQSVTGAAVPVARTEQE
jgi:hypothetical protein